MTSRFACSSAGFSELCSSSAREAAVSAALELDDEETLHRQQQHVDLATAARGVEEKSD